MARASGKTKAAPAAATPKDRVAAIVGGLAKEFQASPPAEAAEGYYATTVRDAWHGRTFKIANGSYRLKRGAWAFGFKAGAFVSAVRIDRQDLMPVAVKLIG